MFHTVYDVTTGETTQVPFTPEEQAEFEAAKAASLAEQAEFAKTEYQRQRAAEYPSFEDQFDLIYHGGIDAWKAAIKFVKDKYPKP